MKRKARGLRHLLRPEDFGLASRKSVVRRNHERQEAERLRKIKDAESVLNRLRRSG